MMDTQPSALRKKIRIFLPRMPSTRQAEPHCHDCCHIDVDTDSQNTTLKKVLYAVFFINLGMFFVEAYGGIIADSNALLADSLDMLGDAFVYGITLAVLHKHPTVKAKASFIKGLIMLALGLGVVAESVYKIVFPVLPAGEIITMLGATALLANLVCFLLLLQHRSVDINVRSSWICSRNDLIANGGVIVAGILVIVFESMWPDVLIGLLIAVIVIRSAVSILRDARSQSAK